MAIGEGASANSSAGWLASSTTSRRLDAFEEKFKLLKKLNASKHKRSKLRQLNDDKKYYRAAMLDIRVSFLIHKDVLLYLET